MIGKVYICGEIARTKMRRETDAADLEERTSGMPVAV